jgi:hypothetical protein
MKKQETGGEQDADELHVVEVMEARETRGRRRRWGKGW